VSKAAERLHADAANAKTKVENGFDLTQYDERTLASGQGIIQPACWRIDVNLDTTEMLDGAWSLFRNNVRSGK
jgi:hypothetical protein